MANNNSNNNTQNYWSHLQLNDAQGIAIPLTLEEAQRLERYLEDMYPELYAQLKPYIDQIAELLRNQTLDESAASALVDDIVQRVSVSSMSQGMPNAIPVQAPGRRPGRPPNRPRPMPLPYPMPYPYYPYPIYGRELSPEDLIRIMLLQRLGIYPYY